jgi:hypothetical protein
MTFLAKCINNEGCENTLKSGHVYEVSIAGLTRHYNINDGPKLTCENGHCGDVGHFVSKQMCSNNQGRFVRVPWKVRAMSSFGDVKSGNIYTVKDKFYYPEEYTLTELCYQICCATCSPEKHYPASIFESIKCPQCGEEH